MCVCDMQGSLKHESYPGEQALFPESNGDTVYDLSQICKYLTGTCYVRGTELERKPKNRFQIMLLLNRFLTS